MKQCTECGITEQLILSTYDDGKERAVLCRNHEIMYHTAGSSALANGTMQSQYTPTGSCDLCSNPKIEYTESQASFDLCKKHVHQLILLNLAPNEFFILNKKHPGIFILHDDFYDHDTGEALQPVDA